MSDGLRSGFCSGENWILSAGEPTIAWWRMVVLAAMKMSARICRLTRPCIVRVRVYFIRVPCANCSAITTLPTLEKNMSKR